MVIGLDISTSCTGWAVLNDDGTLAEMGHIDFKSGMSLWEKADHAMAELASVCSRHKPELFFIEESLQGFRPGLSSAQTLLTLAKFNGLLSFFMRQAVGKDPTYISSAQARKACGVKLLQKKKHPLGYGHKEQTFVAISGGLLSGLNWPLKKGMDSGKHLVENVPSYAMDMCDAYVIARAGWTMNKSGTASKVQQKCSPSARKSASSRKRSEKATSPGT